MTLVELVDADGTPLGSATVEEAHRAPGLLHRAFSVFLRDESGRVLLQRRAAVKTRFPLRWGNTCCGHPAPGEDVTAAAARRMAEEIGVAGVPLAEVGVYSYYAEDPATGRVEYEYDHVLVGDVAADLRTVVDPDEVAELRWVSPEELRAELAADPRSYAPWLAGVTGVLASSASPAPSPSPSPSPPPSPSPSPSPSRSLSPAPPAPPAPSASAGFPSLASGSPSARSSSAPDVAGRPGGG